VPPSPSPAEIVPHIIDEEAGSIVDPFRPNWLNLVGHLLPNANAYVMGCYDKPGCPAGSAVQTNIRWMVVACGRLIANDPTLPIPEAILRAQEAMKISEADYAAKALAWQKTNPWTVIFTRNKAGPIGQSIMLPVTQAFYQRVLDGEAATYDCEPGDIRAVSPFVIIEAAIERPKDLGGGKGHTSVPLLIGMSAQLAALSRCDRLPPELSLSILSLAPHALAEERLMNSGFRPTGNRMARTGVRLMQRTLQRASIFDADFIYRAILKELGASLDNPPPG